VSQLINTSVNLINTILSNRRHPYKLFLQDCSSTTRHSYFTHRAARTWNSLPEDSTNFSSL